MRSPSERLPRLLATLGFIVGGCDGESPPFEIEASPPASEERSAPSPEAATMVYEDAEDFAILNDLSNLRAPGLTAVEHERSLQQRARDELQREFPEVSFPSPEDVEALALRWFVQGVGVVAQNHSARSFEVAASFWSSEDEDCATTVPRKQVGPAEAAILGPFDQECTPTHADVVIHDEYGFLLDSRTIGHE
jgi:hypothetical protein